MTVSNTELRVKIKPGGSSLETSHPNFCGGKLKSISNHSICCYYSILRKRPLGQITISTVNLHRFIKAILFLKV